MDAKQIFDGRYGITANELHNEVIGEIKEWCKIHCDNEAIERILDTHEKRPLTQTIRTVLSQLNRQTIGKKR